VSPPVEPGERFYDPTQWEDVAPGEPHVWRTFGYRRTVWEPGRTVLEWDAPAEYSFPSDNGRRIHGGLVATILDTAMGGAAWTVLDHHEVFLTADLRVEYLRGTRVGLLRCEGTVVRRTRRLVFCAGELFDAGGTLLATARCTQAVLSAS
jgi:uncharacterized protein (TIGR00369 family)